ncbi:MULTISPECIES: hypothetical protein [Methylobacterium]|nr:MULTISPECIES: hypothetical protein [Methylobacterium]PIU08190.1 MAG: hypothetical protein COT56_02385 [Methylobacterium sp. CG09_land_8_20_14_0_10_71_15]PIU15700.1 MAG: hypothetical protein COT28_03635 [Methylobacterium sp. CG08_land_8_20_14_0_20_71_15]
MPLLSAHAAALDAVARNLARVPSLAGQPEAHCIAVDEARRELTRLAGRMRHGLMPESANDEEPKCLPAVVVHGHSQVIVSVARGPRGDVVTASARRR